MKKCLLFLLITTNAIIVNSQNYEVTYGIKLGVNSSFMGSKSSYTLLDEYENKKMIKENNPLAGYDLGLFINIKPLNSRLNYKTGLLISKYNNIYTIATEWDYFLISTGRWYHTKEFEKIKNNFSVISIPLTVGYDFIPMNSKKVNLFCGFSPSINMNDDHVKYDNNLEEIHLYKIFYVTYNAGISVNFDKIYCTLKFERSFNIKKTKSRDYFPYSMSVEKIYLNTVSIDIGLRLN